MPHESTPPRIVPPPVPAQWSPVWSSLVEHFQLLHKQGRTLEDVATLFATALAPDHPDEAEAHLQLLSILRHLLIGVEDSSLSEHQGDARIGVEDSSLSEHQGDARIGVEDSSLSEHQGEAHIGVEDSSLSEHTAAQEDAHIDTSKATGTALNESAAYKSLVMSMGTTNGDDSCSSVDLMDATGGLPIDDDDLEAIVTTADTLRGVPHMTQDVHHMTQDVHHMTQDVHHMTQGVPHMTQGIPVAPPLCQRYAVNSFRQYHISSFASCTASMQVFLT